MKYFYFLITMIAVFSTHTLYAQRIVEEQDVIQLSGQVYLMEDGEILPLPYITVYIKETNRGVYSDEDGFFSIVVEKKDTVVFSGLGLEDASFVIPDTLTGTRYSILQEMTTNPVTLPTTVIYPWPSKEHFKIEFLAMDVSDPLLETAEKNLDEKSLARVDEILETSGAESASFYFQKQAQEIYSVGQVKPQNIFSPIAWAKFFKALKDGDFKQKKNK